MNYKYLLYTLLVLAVTAEALAASVAMPDTGMDSKMEDSTESPIADLAIIDSVIKSSTEKPPTPSSTSIAGQPSEKKGENADPQPHTVADFIIHPLIAFKPRAPEEDVKQATGSSSTTTPSPWTLFGFNAGQGLGSSVTSLAGSVTGWLNDRIQLPGLVDSPIRESSTSSSTTTTTQRPDVVVRVQHKASTRRPVISINNRNRPNPVNNNNFNFDSEEDDDDEDFFEEEYDDDVPNKQKNKRRRGEQNKEEYDDDDDIRPVRRPNNRPNKRRRPTYNDFNEEEYDDSQSEEHDDDQDDDENNGSQADDDDEEEDFEQRPNNRRRAEQGNNYRRRQQHRPRQNVGSQRQHLVNNAPLRRPQSEEEKSAEVEDDDTNEQFFYGEQQARPSMKRSQTQTNFIQRGQQNLINQIRQLTGGKTPAEIGALMRRSESKGPSTKNKKRRQQATLLVNRNGQTLYVAPELLSTDLNLLNPQVQYIRQGVTQYPQPPLTVPLKRKGRPTQYITIPWSQLGISPPEQVVSLTEGVQTQPLILNIPQSAINTMQSPTRKQRPVITSDAVPLLAEASLMDVFKPPKIPASRHSTSMPIHRPIAISGTPVIIASKMKPSAPTVSTSAAVLPQRIRPATIVEKAPANMEMQPASDELSNESITVNGQSKDTIRSTEKEYIIVGEDNEPGLTRQVKPVYAEARYVYGANRSPYLELLAQGRFAARKSGRALEQTSTVDTVNRSNEAVIPVHILTEEEKPNEATKEKKEEQLSEQKEKSSVAPAVTAREEEVALKEASSNTAT